MNGRLFSVVLIAVGLFFVSAREPAASPAPAPDPATQVTPAAAPVDDIAPEPMQKTQSCWWHPSGRACPTYPNQADCEEYCAKDPKKRCGGATSCVKSCGTAGVAC